MLESDNNVSEWVQKKTKDLTFIFNNGRYNMFESFSEKKKEIIPSPDGNEKEVFIEVPTMRKGSAIYRKGRLGHFFYKEGNEDPIDFRNLEITGNPQVRRMLTKIDLSTLFEEDNGGLINFLRKYGILIVIVLIFVVLIVIVQNLPKDEKIPEETLYLLFMLFYPKR